MALDLTGCLTGIIAGVNGGTRLHQGLHEADVIIDGDDQMEIVVAASVLRVDLVVADEELNAASGNRH
jgi:hypothetical protein